MIKTVIIEDESKVRETLVLLLSRYCPELSICGTAGSFEEGFLAVRNHQPELLFADIELHSPEGTGIELVQALGAGNIPVIFISGWREYAVDAFRVKAVDYLLKPISIRQLTEAVYKAKQLLQATGPAPVLEDTVHIPTLHGFKIVRQQEIIRCEAEGPYTHFYLLNKVKVTASMNLGLVGQKLRKELFFRVHKSHLVSRTHLVEYQRGEGGAAKMSDQSEVPVSRKLKDAFLLWLG